MLDIIDSCAPGVQLHHVHLDKAEKPSEIIDPNSYALAAFALLDPELMNGRWNGRQRPLMEIGFTPHPPHQGQGPPADVG